MLKKQHILLGVLFLGISIKPMEKSVLTKSLSVGAAVVVGIGLTGYRAIHSCRIRKQLCEDKGPYGSEIHIYPGVIEEEENEEEEEVIFKSIETYEKKKSNLPFFGIADTSGEESAISLLPDIDKGVKSEHIPTLWDIFKGRSGYNQLNHVKIKEVIERYNRSRYRSMGSKKFDQDLICGWLEVRKGIKTIHLVRCLNNKSKEESGLSQKYRLFEAWLGNTKDSSYEQLLEFEKEDVQILSKEIKNKNSFIVCALFSHLPGE